MTKTGQLPPLNATNDSADFYQNDKFILEGVDHYKSLFSFTQRKVEYENFRFKYPTLLAVVIESINSQVIDNQKIIGKFFYRFHVSDDLTVGELAEIIKFKINAKIRDDDDKLAQKERILFFNNRLSCSEQLELKDVYEKMRETDGWLYLNFIIEQISS
eukprot:403338183